MPRPIFMLAGTGGADTGTVDAKGDYSAGTDFYIEADAKWEIERLLVSIIDGGNPEAEEYGRLSALTNGVTVHVSRLVEGDRVEQSLTPLAVKTNGLWGAMCYDVNILNWNGTSLDQIVARWTFGKSGSPLTLGVGDRVIVRLADDMTGIEAQYFLFQGVTHAYTN